MAAMSMDVDGRTITAMGGQSVLDACLANGIYIPHLCDMEEDHRPFAGCRLCFVSVHGVSAPMTACTLPASDGLRVHTDTDAVRRLQRTALKLLLSDHVIDCKRCHANRACALQTIAAFLGVRLKPAPLEQIRTRQPVDQRHPDIDHHPDRCVRCGKCVRTCRINHSNPQFCFWGRGLDIAIGHQPMAEFPSVDCRGCGRCVAICPVGALLFRCA